MIFYVFFYCRAIYATALLNPHVFALFSNMKLAFAALLTKLMLGKQFTVVQCVSIGLLILCLVVSKIDMFLECNATTAKARILLGLD